MKYKIKSELVYEVYADTAFFLNIQVAKSRSQHVISELFTVSNNIVYKEFSLANNDTRFLKFNAKQGQTIQINYQTEVEVFCKQISRNQLLQATAITDLDNEVLPFIAPSRHCESDKFIKFVNKEFGYYTSNFEKVLAINDWIFNNIDYTPGVTSSNTSANDTLVQREGVCKDFAHLGIALCRALDIPARYFTSYTYQLAPPDIHACFEAYIAGEWIVFDPTKLAPLNGLVKIANGKDATEAPVASFYGNTYCTLMNIECIAIEPFEEIVWDGEVGGIVY
ncbi:MAG: hypothetical protein RLZZ175_2864 [Bacteroidota bacterium]|jgi:transglutaminase-like putative cysteine protease